MKNQKRMQVIVALVATALMFMVLPACKKNAKPGAKGPATAKPGTRAAAKPVVNVKDYVCGMTIDSNTAPHKHTYKGHTYHFCNAGCLKLFKKTPEKYAALRAKDVKKAAPAAPADPRKAAPKAPATR